MSATIVDRLHDEFSGILSVLDRESEISLRNVANENFRKTLLMAAASHFERCMTEAVLHFVARVTREGHVLTWLVKNKVVSRQYHTWFDWQKKNANSFFGLFGDSFLECMKAKVAQDDELESSIQAFLEVGRERNRLVHQDFGNFSLEKTTEEIFSLYRTAMKFVEWFPGALEEFSSEAVHETNAQSS